MGKYKSFVLLGVAVIIALVTSALIYGSLKKNVQNKATPLPTAQIAVSVADLTWGTVLTPEMVKMVPYLKENLPQGSIGEPAQVVGRVLVSPVKASEPILESRLAPTTFKTGGVAAVISPQKRAVAVKVDQVIGVAGFIHSGNRVDVMVTLSNVKNTEPITKTVLENILVLAAGSEVEKKGKDPLTVTVITLEVTPEEAEKLALSAAEGKLQLALRSFNDTEGVRTQGVTVPVLLSSLNGHPAKKPAAAPPKSLKNPSRVPKSPTVLAAKKPEEKAALNAARAKEPEKSSAEKLPLHIVQLIKGSKVSEVKFETEEENQ
jgi:pilus assembly protein CpaB